METTIHVSVEPQGRKLKRKTKQVSEPVASVTSAPADKDHENMNRRNDQVKTGRKVSLLLG